MNSTCRLAVRNNYCNKVLLGPDSRLHFNLRFKNQCYDTPQKTLVDVAIEPDSSTKIKSSNEITFQGCVTNDEQLNDLTALSAIFPIHRTTVSRIFYSILTILVNGTLD
ncbi:hypothetical protein PV328_006036 [Microctonus aethiopoides]|uniref:Uncharacterized protein n=1 Tax=Microctonus aethiopoides TaxID=144406 RepID=A0AA39FNG0_9HYME|nr:hypothetical protein PV328_006036 [Microctonus aethiopoides]